MAFKYITLTGADSYTSIKALVELAAEYDQLEIGFLYSASSESGNRYPSAAKVTNAVQALAGRCAVHICGSRARSQMLAGEIEPMLMHAQRVQVNGALTLEEVQLLSHRAREIIVQYNDNNAHLLSTECKNVSFLVDASGGRGISPSKWVRPETSKAVGFAGGLGPNNLSNQLKEIAPVAGVDSWVDMESQLRENDWFSIRAARLCLDAFQRHQDEASHAHV